MIRTHTKQAQILICELLFKGLSTSIYDKLGVEIRLVHVNPVPQGLRFRKQNQAYTMLFKFDEKNACAYFCLCANRQFKLWIYTEFCTSGTRCPLFLSLALAILAISTCSSGYTISPLRESPFNPCAFLIKHVKLIISLSLCLYGRILNTTLFESWEIVGPYPSWWVFNLLLVLLQLLHSFWSYLIVKTACRAISKGKVSHYTQTLFRLALHTYTFHLYLFLHNRVFCC